MTKTMHDLFGVAKPVIAMAHLPALPGTARYDASSGVEGMVERVARDVKYLLDGGVDSIIFCNEDDRPYRLEGDLIDAATMARVVAELRPTDRPFGVDYLWDARTALAVATATGAAFIREVVTGVYESDMGLWEPQPAVLYRERSAWSVDHIKIFTNVTPEFGSPLGNRSIAARAKSAVVSSLVDGILIAGPMAGAKPRIEWVREAKEAVGPDVPVLLNTGADEDNIAGFLEVADGVIVGSALKEDGQTWNPVDPERVRRFMRAADAGR